MYTTNLNKLSDQENVTNNCNECNESETDLTVREAGLSHAENYSLKIDEIKAVPVGKLHPIGVPVRTFAKEAVGLYEWALDDRARLEVEGLPPALLDDIPVRGSALREAQSNWVICRNEKKEAARQWAAIAPEAEDLASVLQHRFYFAFRDNPQPLGRLREVSKGRKQEDLVQFLNDLSKLGSKYQDLLVTGTFDMSLLDRTAAYSFQLDKILGVKAKNRKESTEIKLIRDQAYTLLKDAVDEVREYGQFIFWRDDLRSKGYASDYLRQANKEDPEEEEEDETMEAVSVAAGSPPADASTEV
ncbi:MAG: hypothetical protein GY765_03840 [bacterium]|nr:hypothetical protein [bacterium]